MSNGRAGPALGKEEVSSEGFCSPLHAWTELYSTPDFSWASKLNAALTNVTRVNPWQSQAENPVALATQDNARTNVSSRPRGRSGVPEMQR